MYHLQHRFRWAKVKPSTYYFPFGREGGLFPLPPPDGLPVVLGPFGGLVPDLLMIFLIQQ
jgi:hypothetical protein